MRVIQPILLSGILLALFLYLRFLRSSLRDRLIVVVLLVAGCVAIVVPDATQALANLVGVGRGTDLTFYLLAVGFIFFAVLTHSRLTRMDIRLTEAVRRLAIAEADRAEDPAAPGHQSPQGVRPE
jgi:hypothetical protein